VAEDHSVDGIVEGWSKRGARSGVWLGQPLPRRRCGRPRTELWGAWCL